MPAETREALRRLAALANVEVAVVSGRSIDDLAARVALPGLTFVGNHGLEIQRQGIPWRHPGSLAAESVMEEVRGRVAAPVQECPGAILEVKGSTMAVHFRLVENQDSVQMLQEAVREAVRPWLERGTVRLRDGKMVIEIRPGIRWDKGYAMAFLMAWGMVAPSEVVLDESGAYTGPTDGRLPLYVGDDMTDEDAFRALAGIGITARVGSPDEPSAAAYSSSSPREVRDFLVVLAEDLERAALRR